MKQPINNKYKTMLCKHFDLQKGCSAGDKCHFAHGTHELRKQEDVINKINQPLPPQAQSYNFYQQVLNNPSMVNYKQMKCYFYERGNYILYDR